MFFGLLFLWAILTLVVMGLFVPGMHWLLLLPALLMLGRYAYRGTRPRGSLSPWAPTLSAVTARLRVQDVALRGNHRRDPSRIRTQRPR